MPIYKMIMKKLVVIRHAKSDWSAIDLNDFDRGLNKRGKLDAVFMGKILKDKKILPDLVISSSAVRTTETCNKILNQLDVNKNKIVYYQALYHANSDIILNHIRMQKNDLNYLFCVGHNPGITEFVNRLCHSKIENIPTCGICIVELNSFTNAKFGDGSLIEFIYPKLYDNKSLK